MQEGREDFIAWATEPHASESGAGYQLISEAGAYGLIYHRAGYEAYAAAVWEISEAHLKMGEFGVRANFHAWWLGVIWDLIEESPVFSDEDWLKITEYLLWIMDSEEGAYTTFFHQGVGHRMVRQNHQTLVALAAWFGGRYFSTHYGFEEGKEWMAASADVFKGQAVSFKPIEDANANQWMTLDHILTYTLASGDTTYIDNGNCKRSLDQAVFYCNNRRELLEFGDTGVPTDGYPTNLLVKAGHVLQDGRAEFLLRKRFDRPSDYFRPEPPGGWYEAVSDPFLVRSFEKYFCNGLEPKTPEKMLGVQALEVSGGFYDFSENPMARPSEVKLLNLAREEAFDTVCFREGFGREDQYLMLHGIFYGNHSREDGNTISEYSANDTKPVDDRMRRVGDSAVVVEGAEGWMAVGTGDKEDAFSVGPLSGRAAVYAVGDGWFALCNGTSLSGGGAIFESEKPVSIEFDLKKGEGVVVASESGEITLCGERLSVVARRQEVRVREAGAELVSLDGIVDLPTWEAIPEAHEQAVSVPAFRTIWTYDAGSGVRCAAATGDGVVLGTEDSRVVTLDEIGKSTRSFQVEGSVLSACDVWVWEEDHLILCGTNRSNVFALKMAGGRLETLWKQRVGEEVNAVSVVDVDGDGRPEIVVGSDCFYLYLLGEDGTERWRRNLKAPVERVLAGDLNGDGRAEIAAGCEDGSPVIGRKARFTLYRLMEAICRSDLRTGRCQFWRCPDE